MNTEQARTLIAETFPKAFDKGRFRNFVINLLNHIDESKAQAWNTTYVKDAFKSHVKGYERLGTYTSPDDEKLDVLIVHLTAESKLERTRTAIRNFVADHLKIRDNKDAALVAFVSPSEKQWRFSYVKMEYATVEKEDGKVDVQAKLTPARRSSYIVGEGESCHTAQTRFLDLLRNTENQPTLAQIEDAFSVEAVTKEFFEQYKALFLDLKDELDSLAKKDKAIGAEFTSKKVSTADFAKKLMGQIVFLYFLQKKGWLGVPKEGEWGSGPQNFLRHLFDNKFRTHKNFFNDILEPLFYDTLATDRGHEAWCKTFNCRIPFLNGGLFEPLAGYDWKTTDIVIPNSLFSNTKTTKAGDTGSGILDVFDRYNFTVNEAEPLEKDVAIDPEMLGKVFENLLEVKERKSKGSYYTPREIVHYMCQESLINFLDTALNTDEESIAPSKMKQSKLFGEPAPEQSELNTIVRNEIVPRKEIETFVHLGEQISHYEAVEARYAIKMPKSIEHHARLIDEKLADITVCDPAIGSGAFPVGMMQEIVRARAALTHYFNDVHDRTPYHFKRHAIQSCLYGVDIDPGAVEIAKLRLWLSLVVDEVDVKQIKPLPNLDYKIVTGNSLLSVGKNLYNADLFKQLEELKPRYFDATDRKQKGRFKHEIDDLILALTNGKEIFDFEIYFSEVFHKKGGFDAVIANPPYVFTRGSDFSSEFKKLISQSYVSGSGKLNLFTLFIERAAQILGAGGVYAYIIPNTFFRATSYEPIRKLIVKNQRVLTIVDLHEGVFDGVTASTTVILVQKSAEANEAIKVLDEAQELGAVSVHRSMKQSQFDNPGFIFSIYLNNSSRAIFEKMAQNTTKLEALCLDIMEGIVTPKGKDNFISDSQKTTKYKPFLEGKDVGRYQIEWKHKYILFDRDVLHRARPDYVWESKEKILIRRIGGGATAIFAALDTRQYYTFASINNLLLKPNSPIGYKYLLALLNSKLLNWFYVENFTNRSKLTVNISRTYLDQLPICLPKRNQEEAFVSLVDRIMAMKQREAGADTNVLEQEIDKLVYALYGLTHEEIAIIEAAH